MNLSINHISASKTRSREIANSIVRRVIDGVYPPSTFLPTERQLSEEFGVARTIVREALKRIETMNIITIRQGSGALVEDVDTSGGIELSDFLMVQKDGSIDNQFLKDVGQLHEGLHIWLVRIAAQRITADEIKALKKRVEKRAALVDDDEKLPGITLQITRSIVQASRNKYVQLLFNTLVRTTQASRIVFEMPFYFEPAAQTFFERLIEAFENKDGEMAALLATRMFESNRKNYLRAIDRLSKQVVQ